MMPFGNLPGQVATPGMAPPVKDGAEQTAQAITAALLTAAKENCQCKTCQILRGVIDKMAEPFLQSVNPPKT